MAAIILHFTGNNFRQFWFFRHTMSVQCAEPLTQEGEVVK